jgi:phage virion morphogenesis protein
MISIDLKARTLTAALDRLTAGLDDMSPLMADFGEYLVEATRTRFQEGKGPDGAPWAPKSEATLEAYRRRKDPASPRPLIGPSRSLSTTIFARTDARAAEVGSPLIYAAVMQFGAARGAFGAIRGGSPIPWGTIPARPYLGLSQADEAALIAIAEEYLESLAGD